MPNDLYTKNLDVVQKAAFIIYGIVGIMWIMNASREMPWNRCAKIVVRFRQTFKDFKLSVRRYTSSDSFFLPTQQFGAVFNFHVSRKDCLNTQRW